MKRKNILYLMLINILLTHNISAQSWLWSKHIGGEKRDEYTVMCTDNSGNIYIAGSYQSDSCFFDTDTLTLFQYDPAGFFIAKYDPAGNEQWVRGFNGTTQNNLNAGITSIVFNQVNNYIYITGSVLGDGNIAGFDVSSGAVPMGVLIAKFDLNGNCIWAKRAGSPCNGPNCSTCISYGWRITTDEDGDIIITGQNRCSASFDTITIDPGYFLAKYDANGNCIWAKKKFDPNLSNQGYEALLFSLKTKGKDIFAMGQSTMGTFTVDGITINPNYTNGQFLIARFDSSGTAKWIKSCAGKAYGGGSDIAIDDSSNIYFTGAFNQDAFFDSDTLHTNNPSDFCFAKFNSAGQVLWAKQGNSSISSGMGSALYNSSNSSIYLLGGFEGSLTLGSNVINSTGLFGDLFIARYSVGGNLIGLNQAPVWSASSISLDSNGSIYVTGGFGLPQDSIVFGNNPPLVTYGKSDIFIAKSDVITDANQGGNNRKSKSNQLLIYANPNKGICNVTVPDDFLNERNLILKISDHSGRLVQEIPVQMHEGKISLNIEAEAKGIYNATLTNGQKIYYGKIVFE
jgi:hypothetical protein